MTSSHALRVAFGLILASLGALGLSACSTVRPVESGRAGLLDKLSDGRRAEGGGRARAADSFAGAYGSEALRLNGLELQWPLGKVAVSSSFGQRGRDFHEGIDLRAAIGTPVYSAEAGTVLYAGQRIRGYGRMIVIRHSKDISTVYAHNSKLTVKVGDTVKKGQLIALSGNSGRTSGPHLHFEIRSGVAAVDPERTLGKSSGERSIADVKKKAAKTPQNARRESKTSSKAKEKS